MECMKCLHTWYEESTKDGFCPGCGTPIIREKKPIKNDNPLVDALYRIHEETYSNQSTSEVIDTIRTIATKALDTGVHFHSSKCWEPNSGCDIGRNKKFAKVAPEDQLKSIDKAIFDPQSAAPEVNVFLKGLAEAFKGLPHVPPIITAELEDSCDHRHTTRRNNGIYCRACGALIR